METVDPASVHPRIHHVACMVALCLTWPTELRGMCWSKFVKASSPRRTSAPPSAWLGTQSRWLSVNFGQIDKRQDLNLQEFHQGRWNSPKSPYLARSLSHQWPSHHSTGRLPFDWTVKLTSTEPTSAWSTEQPSDIVRLPQLHISHPSFKRRGTLNHAVDELWQSRHEIIGNWDPFKSPQMAPPSLNQCRKACLELILPNSCHQLLLGGCQVVPSQNENDRLETLSFEMPCSLQQFFTYPLHQIILNHSLTNPSPLVATVHSGQKVSEVGP